MSNDPYEVLGLPRDADETAVRRRYLELVRLSPPDRDPERFTAVRAGYDELRDPVRRLESRILKFNTTDSIEALQADLRALLRARLDRLPTEALLSLAETK